MDKEKAKRIAERQYRMMRERFSGTKRRKVEEKKSNKFGVGTYGK